MLTRVLHAVAAHPAIYNLIQRAVGGNTVRQWLGRHCRPLGAGAAYVLDLGGGTGLYRDFWPPTAAYVCLDIDPQKLQGFTANAPGNAALLADGTRMPLADGAIDVVFCTFVTHHIPDELLLKFFSESERVLKPGGTLVLVDALWMPERWIARILWKLDRGSNPRTAEKLAAAISTRYAIQQVEQLAVWHTYQLFVARKRAS